MFAGGEIGPPVVSGMVGRISCPSSLEDSLEGFIAKGQAAQQSAVQADASLFGVLEAAMP